MALDRVLLLATLLAITGCGTSTRPTNGEPGIDERTITGTVLGEPYAVAYADPVDRDLHAAFDSLAEVLTRSLSPMDSASALNTFNLLGAAVASSADPHLTECMRLAKGLTLMTRGAFDATCWPLDRAWRTARARNTTLDPVQAADLRTLGGVAHVQVQGEGADAHLVKTDDRAGAVLGAMMRGYCVDRMADLLMDRGVPTYRIDMGPLHTVHGAKGRVVEGAAPADSVRLLNRSMATARAGDRYDPRTGAAVANGIRSATVIHDRCVAAEAIANALVVMGPNTAKAWLAQVPRVQAAIVISDGRGAERSWGTFDWPGRTDERTRRLPTDALLRSSSDSLGTADSVLKAPTAAELRNARKAPLIQAELDRMSGKADSIKKAEAGKKKELRPSVQGH